MIKDRSPDQSLHRQVRFDRKSGNSGADPDQRFIGDQPEEKIEGDPNVSAVLEEIKHALEAELSPGTEILIEPNDQGALLKPPRPGMLPMAAGLVATRSFRTWAQQVDRAVASANRKKWRELRYRRLDKRKNR